MVVLRSAAFVVLCSGAGCSDLLHSTDWKTRCELADAGSCASSSGTGGSSGVGGTSSSTSGGAGGAGGTTPDGLGPDTAGASCKQLLEDGHSTGDGNYWIDPDAAGAPFQAYCAMSNGGWTLAGVVAALGDANWSALTSWTDAGTFGVSSSTDFSTDMKNLAWGALGGTQLRLETEAGGYKESDPFGETTLAVLFASKRLLVLEGKESGWVYASTNDQNFFAVIQNPPSDPTINLSPRNRCVLTMGFDAYAIATGPDNEVQGFGCTAGDGGGNGACFRASCGDVVRDSSIRVYVR